MELTNFSNYAKIEILVMAYYHLFFAENYQINMQNIQKFNADPTFLMTENGRIVLEILNLIADDKGYPPFVANNVVDYVATLRDFSSQLSAEKKKLYFDLANQILLQNRIYQNNVDYRFMLSTRLSGCLDFKDSFQILAEDINVTIEKSRLFLTQLFYYSIQVLEEKEVVNDPLNFLRYCNFLIYNKSFLLREPLYLEQLKKMVAQTKEKKERKKMLQKLENL